MQVAIEKAMLHWVPRISALSVDQAVVLTNSEAPLQPDHKSFLETKIQGSLASRYSYGVVLQAGLSTPVPSHVADLLSAPTPEKLVSYSRDWAQHLYKCQHGNSPDGLLMVAQCKVGGGDLAIVVVKLEQEKGVRAEKTLLADGKTTYVMQLLTDLVLTTKTQVFKVGLFYDVKGVIEGYVSDHQMGFNPKQEVARFFLDKFLGGRLKLNPYIATTRFIDETCIFINTHVSEPDEKVQLYTHLVSVITDERETLSAPDFAKDFMAKNRRDDYLEHLAKRDVPLEVFEKNHEAIASRLSRMSVEFESGVRVLGPTDAFCEKVSLEEVEEGLTKAEIVDKLKKVGRA